MVNGRVDDTRKSLAANGEVFAIAQSDRLGFSHYLQPMNWNSPLVRLLFGIGKREQTLFEKPDHSGKVVLEVMRGSA